MDDPSIARCPALHVSALELPARWGQREVALNQIDQLLSLPPRTDLAVLPEGSLDGYVSPGLDFDATAFAEPADGPAATALAELARRHRCHLAGSMVERAGGRFYNALLVFAPDGHLVAHYRKRHPWYPETWATPGESLAPVFDVGPARVTLAVCFDVHFLDEAQAQLREADVLLFPSAWVDDQGDARADLLPSLAKRHDVNIVNANWGHGAPAIRGQGRSRIVARDGSLLAISVACGRIDAAVRIDGSASAERCNEAG